MKFSIVRKSKHGNNGKNQHKKENRVKTRGVELVITKQRKYKIHLLNPPYGL